MHTFYSTDTHFTRKNAYILFYGYSLYTYKCIHSILRILTLHIKIHTFYSTDGHFTRKNAYILFDGCSLYM